MIGVSSPLFSLSNTLTPAQSSPDNIQAWQEQGWFTAKHLLAQVKDAIDIFEGHTNGYVQGIFLFNNAPSHQKHADSALSISRSHKGAAGMRSVLTFEEVVWIVDARVER
jgi:hypothetical protein